MNWLCVQLSKKLTSMRCLLCRLLQLNLTPNVISGSAAQTQQYTNVSQLGGPNVVLSLAKTGQSLVHILLQLNDIVIVINLRYTRTHCMCLSIHIVEEQMWLKG